MTRRLLLQSSPGEIWAAVAEGDELVALRLFRSVGGAHPGDIYLGRVLTVHPELSAVSIDIGMARPAFLDGKHELREGEAVLVEVMKEARADKAVGVGMKLGITGDRRDALLAGSRNARPPSLLERRETALAAALGGFIDPAPDEILVDDSSAVPQARHWLRQYLPTLADNLRLHNETTQLFEAYGVAAAIETALLPRVSLPQGGAITIETTSAAILIDVDSGQRDAVAANLVAGREIARQIALRDLAGPIVIDFIGMKKPEDKARVRAALADTFGGDRDIQLLGWTRLGHLELVRKRRRASLAELLYEHASGGAPIKQPLTVALEALRHLSRASRFTPGKRFGLRVHPEIAACLDTVARSAVRDLETRLGHPIEITTEARARDSFALDSV